MRRMNQKFSGKPQNYRAKVLKNYLLSSKYLLFEIQFSLISVQLLSTDGKTFFWISTELSYFFPHKYSRYLIKIRINEKLPVRYWLT